MKTIFETFKKSVYSQTFYQTAGANSFWSIFKYYIRVTFFLSVAMVVILGVTLVPRGVSFMKNQAGAMISKYYPDDLSIQIKNGEAITDVAQPYIIPIKQMTGVTPPATGMQNMIVIDTNSDFNEKTFEDYKTYVLLTKTKLVTQSNAEQITIQNLRGVPDTIISQEVLLSWVEKIRASLWSIVLFGLLATFIIFIFGYLAYLIPLIVFALIPFFIAWMKKTPLTYAEAYKMSMYAILPALALKTILNLLGIFFLPAYFTLLVFMLIIAINMREVETPNLFEGK